MMVLENYFHLELIIPKKIKKGRINNETKITTNAKRTSIFKDPIRGNEKNTLEFFFILKVLYMSISR